MRIKQPSTTVCNELKESYQEVDLELVFLEEAGAINRKVDRRILEQGVFRLADTSRVENRFGIVEIERYRPEITCSIGSYIDDCVKYGLLRELESGCMVLEFADPTLMESERNGITIELNRTKTRTVFRERIAISGRPDIQTNGDPAIEGVTAEEALSW